MRRIARIEAGTCRSLGIARERPPALAGRLPSSRRKTCVDLQDRHGSQRAGAQRDNQGLLRLPDCPGAPQAEVGRLFRSFDVVIAPCYSVVAFPYFAEHDPWPGLQRTLRINGADVPYTPQHAWPLIAGIPHLPATAAPIGRTRHPRIASRQEQRATQVFLHHPFGSYPKR